MKIILSKSGMNIIGALASAASFVAMCAIGFLINHYGGNLPSPDVAAPASAQLADSSPPVAPVNMPARSDVNDSVADDIITAAETADTNDSQPLASVITEINEPQPSEWKTVRMRVTAYCPCPLCCPGSSDGITANGHVIESGDCFAAADEKFPFGTEVIVPGYNHDQPVKIMDRGSAIYDDRLDVFFTTHYSAKRWGVKYLDVKVRTPAIAAVPDPDTDPGLQ